METIREINSFMQGTEWTLTKDLVAELVEIDGDLY